MLSVFSFKGELGRWAYLAAASAAFLSQHAYVLAASLSREAFRLSPWFAINPLRFLPSPFAGPDFGWQNWGALAVAVAAGWALAALGFRRAARAGASGVWATLSAIPVIQVLAIAALASAPDRPVADPAPHEIEQRAAQRGVTAGLLAGVALTVALTAFATLALGNYGYALFLGAPLVIAMTVAYAVNRDAARTLGASIGWALLGLLLGACALLAVALEGLFCIIVVSPLAAAMGVIGAALGRALARARKGGALSVAVLPLLMLAEAAAPPRAAFESVESVVIAAPPAAVWRAITHMDDIPEPPAAPFRWGLAYPVRGELIGEGVGAVRRGVFSTGVAYERVTVWEPGRRLWFDVLSNPPTLDEMSPYARVHAPHLDNSFRTEYARFAIAPLKDGTTRLSLATRHTLALDPVPYWLPLAQWTVQVNKARVLAHFKRQAEGAGD